MLVCVHDLLDVVFGRGRMPGIRSKTEHNAQSARLLANEWVEDLYPRAAGDGFGQAGRYVCHD